MLVVRIGLDLAKYDAEGRIHGNGYPPAQYPAVEPVDDGGEM